MPVDRSIRQMIFFMMIGVFRNKNTNTIQSAATNQGIALPDLEFGVFDLEFDFNITGIVHFTE
jgi:hypothetical protein